MRDFSWRRTPLPTGLLVLAAYIEERIEDLEIDILDCQAERKDYKAVEKYILKYIESHSPSIIVTSGFTCNAYVCARVAEIAKKVSTDIVTIVGGQHFSFTAEESLRAHTLPEYSRSDYFLFF